eukprot:1152934-Pelagomonas_calceolata.AAC.3
MVGQLLDGGLPGMPRTTIHMTTCMRTLHSAAIVLWMDGRTAPGWHLAWNATCTTIRMTTCMNMLYRAAIVLWMDGRTAPGWRPASEATQM